jgi:allophanate hydrolase
VEVEIRAFDPAAFALFVEKIPSPLGIGKVSLDDGSDVSGFLCEAVELESAEEITRFGGWRGYIAERVTK